MLGFQDFGIFRVGIKDRGFRVRVLRKREKGSQWYRKPDTLGNFARILLGASS